MPLKKRIKEFDKVKMRRKNIIFSSVLTVIAVSLLIMLGPANAFVLSLNLMNGGVFVQGEKVEYKVSAQIENGEGKDIQSFRLFFDGPESFSCEFLPNGTLVSFCPFLSIKQTENAPSGFESGYGYGFLEGKLEYDIILDTTSFDLGRYESKLFVTIDENEMQSDVARIINIAEGDLLNSCSIRAKDGIVDFNGVSISSKNRLSLFVPTSDASKGHGSLTAQNRRDRISYTFKVDKARRVEGGKMVFNISGILRRGVNKTAGTEEKAEIIFDSNNFELKIDGMVLDAKDMDVYFVKC